MFRYIAPSGTKITILDILAWFFDIILFKDRSSTLRNSIINKYQTRHCFLMASGRAAMAMLFRMLKDLNKDPSRCEIIVPSYTCYSVPAAVEIAGLKLRVCDIDRNTLSYDMNQLKAIDFSKVIAIVSSSLYGIPNDLPAIRRLADENGIVFIDDAAQAMNSSVDDQYSGSYGHIGLYSLDKGKNITSIQGGIIVTNDDNYAAEIERRIDKLQYPSASYRLKEAIQLLAYTVLLRPWLYWIPARAPFLGLGKTLYTTDYYYSRYSRHLASIATRLFKRIESITQSRKRNFNTLARKLADFPGLSLPTIPSNIDHCALRFPVFVQDPIMRSEMIAALHEIGIGATASYPDSINRLDEVSHFIASSAPCPGGEYVADHVMTLPTMEYLSELDVENIHTQLQMCVKQKSLEGSGTE